MDEREEVITMANIPITNIDLSRRGGIPND